MSVTSLLSLRRVRSIRKPLLEEFKGWLEKETMSGRILPKSDIKKAFTYTLNQWNALNRYVQEGYLLMDNNLAERMVKYAAIGPQELSLRWQ